MQRLLNDALPVLYRLFGSPSDPPAALDVSERGRQEIAGYGGQAGCLPTAPACSIELSPLLGDIGILHEFAHLWTPVYGTPWIAEGMAEFMARRAAAELGIPDDEALLETPVGEPIVLDDWRPSWNIIGANRAELEPVYSGYLQSLRLVEEIERTVGFGDLQAAYERMLEKEEGLNSRRFLDALEEASGAHLDALFRGNVFPSSFAPTLVRRRKARDDFAALRYAAASAGVHLPEHIGDAISEWHFDDAISQIGKARSAVAAYAAAKKELEGARGGWQRFGIVNRKPDNLLADAATSISSGRFEEAAALASQAQAVVDEAGRVALARLLVAVTMFLLIVGSFGVALWRRRRSLPHRAGRPSTPTLDTLP